MIENNLYEYISDYPQIYSNLVFERNHTIMWLERHGMAVREKTVDKTNEKEWLKHRTATAYRMSFKTNVTHLLDRLYHHDAVEALYDFGNVELGGWSNTEANMLERELQNLQKILGKLEARYSLQYKLVIEYNHKEQKLYLNGVEILSPGESTLRHRLLTALYSKPDVLWEIEMLEEHFIENFGYREMELTDKAAVKAAKDLERDVAAKVGIKEFLIVNVSSIRVNQMYLPFD